MSERKKWTLDDWKKDKEELEETKKDIPLNVVGLLPDSPVNVSGVLPPGYDISPPVQGEAYEINGEEFIGQSPAPEKDVNVEVNLDKNVSVDFALSDEDEPVRIKSNKEDNNDKKGIRHGRSQYEGFNIGHYVQTPPILFTRDSHNVFMGDMYRGATAFLILGGPSMKNLNLDSLKRPGILTMGVNNSVRTFRPNLWTCVDNPSHFIKSIWFDPTITKLVPMAHAEKKIFDNVSWKEMDMVVGSAPNVFYYRRNEHFVPSQFLFEDTINWGNHSNLCHCGFWRGKSDEKKVSVCPDCGEKAFGSRSVFLPAIRLLYYLGVRNIFLLGCDFNMKKGEQNYHFEQDRTSSSVNNNNNSYRMLAKRFEDLKPYFKKYGLQIFNCNPDSALEVFPKVSFKDAIDAALHPMPDTENERTEGLYDREAKLKAQGKSK